MIGKPKVCLFFTFDMSLKKWEESGLLDREAMIYRELVQQGCSVAFFTYGDERDLEYAERLQGIRIIPAYAYQPSPTSKWLRVLKSFVFPFQYRALLATYPIFKTNQMKGSWVPLIACWLTSSKLIVRCGYEYYSFLLKEKKELWKRGLVYLQSKLTYGYASQILVTSEQSAKFIVDHFNIPQKKIEIHPNAVDLNAFQKQKSQKSLNRVLFVGRLSEQKNLFNLLEAVKKAGAGIDLIGDGPLKKKLFEFSKEKGIDSQLLGVVPNSELPKKISEYPIFVLPSHYEGNPKALIEAMACERAVIGSDVEGIQELIEDGKTGLLAKKEPESLSEKIKTLMDDPPLRERLGKNARTSIEKHCSLKSLSQLELRLYSETLGMRA